MYRDGFYRHRIMAVVTIIMIIAVVLVGRPPQTQGAKFVITSLEDRLDEYGQGIDGCEIYENSTASWVVIDYPFYIAYYEGEFEWNLSVGIKLHCFTYFNSTLTGAGDTAEGQQQQRHNVTVQTLGVEVFNKSGFTYIGVNTALDPIWIYEYSVILNFEQVAGTIYEVIVSYEIYW